jgi:glycosyltransferase involved in cell wall biosynthesis
MVMVGGFEMIVGMMRIKNEARWIERVLRSMLPMCERIFILDDHSTDDTVAICESFPEVTLFRSEFEGLEETRDKNFLIEKVEQEVPEGSWIICIDGDEEIAPGGQDRIREIIDNPATYQTSFRFHVKYLWDREDQWRTDGIYAEFHRPSMFRLTRGQRYQSAAGGGFHCGNVPDSGGPGGSPRTAVKLLHYGYLYREDRLRKFEWYNAADKQPVPELEDSYRHMVIGDMFPPETKTRWGGPLELRSL